VAAPAASANYTLGINASAIVIGPGAETSISVTYSRFCFFGCPATQPVGSVIGVAFTNGSGGACTDTSGGNNTDFNRSFRGTVQVTGTANADSATGTCFLGSSSLSFTGLCGDGRDTVDGQAGNDTVRGGAGRDLPLGGSGNDTLQGEDVSTPGRIPDFVDGGAGNDRISARDGAQDRIQCDDGNASRRPGFTDKPGNGIDEDCSGADAPFLRIFSPVQFLVTTASSRTTFSRLRVQAVPEGATIEVRCTGGTRKGCFSGVKRFSLPKGAELRDIRSAVRGRRFLAGARVEVRILDADSIGKVFRFTMNAGKKTPTTSSLCLVPGQNAPGRCPRA